MVQSLHLNLEKKWKKIMPTKHSFMVKVIDARLSDLRKVLKDAGVNVVSIAEIHKEDVTEEITEESEAKEGD
jgi:hypothetical protein